MGGGNINLMLKYAANAPRSPVGINVMIHIPIKSPKSMVTVGNFMEMLTTIEIITMNINMK